MDFFVKKIFDGNSKDDEFVHRQFQKFGRGTFKNRSVIIAKRSGSKYSIGTTPEYVNEVVKYVAEKLGSEVAEIKGVIITTQDLNGLIKYKDKKQFQGVKKYILDLTMTGTELVGLCGKFPACYFGLSFKTGDTELKIKPKAPKSGKPSSDDKGIPKADFCKIKTTDKNLVRGLLFDIDIDAFKLVEISHTYLISDLILPENVDDPKELREKTKRKGVIKRDVFVDSVEKSSEKPFFV